jgi:hypothetical protein
MGDTPVGLVGCRLLCLGEVGETRGSRFVRVFLRPSQSFFSSTTMGSATGAGVGAGAGTGCEDLKKPILVLGYTVLRD